MTTTAPMKFGFVTCVQLGLACMEEIYRVGGKLDLVVTLEDEIARGKSGRINVDEFCAGNDIPVLKIKNINDAEAIDGVRAHGISWLFVIGWSQIAHRQMLQTPKRGALGMHPTLLPVGRGRAAIPWAILKNLPETGVTLFRLDEGVDTGAIIAQERLPLRSDETATTLYSRVADAHRRLIGRTWDDLTNDRLSPVPQDEARATVWPGRQPADGRLWSTMTVAEVDRLVRATTRPYPGAFCREGETTLRIWRGRIGDASQRLTDGARRLVFADGIYDALDYELSAN